MNGIVKMNAYTPTSLSFRLLLVIYFYLIFSELFTWAITVTLVFIVKPSILSGEPQFTELIASWSHWDLQKQFFAPHLQRGDSIFVTSTSVGYSDASSSFQPPNVQVPTCLLSNYRKQTSLREMCSFQLNQTGDQAATVFALRLTHIFEQSTA